LLIGFPTETPKGKNYEDSGGRNGKALGAFHSTPGQRRWHQPSRLSPPNINADAS